MTDEEQIAEAVERFIRAYNGGDVETIVAYYADDLIKDRQGAPPERKAETVERVRGVLRDFRGNLSVTNDEIVVSGDVAYARGSLRITLTPRAGGAPQRIERRFLEIWRKRGGRWLVTRTMDNTAG